MASTSKLEYYDNSGTPIVKNVFDNNLAGDISNTTAIAHDYIAQLYGKKVLYRFYKDTVFAAITNTDLTSRSLRK